MKPGRFTTVLIFPRKEVRDGRESVSYSKARTRTGSAIKGRSVAHSVSMPSRQERRKEVRDAAKRAPARAGATGDAGAAPARANANTLGDWKTQGEDAQLLFEAHGAWVVKQRADAGDQEAQFSQGSVMMAEADAAAGVHHLGLGASGRSPKADVGLELCSTPEILQRLALLGWHVWECLPPSKVSAAPDIKTTVRRSGCGHLMTICG